MRGQEITAEVLNAYVDGELARADAAGVARAAARSPELAARIATLREMKAAVAEIAPERHLSLPAQRPRRRAAMRFAAAAAVVASLLAGLLYGLVQLEPSEQEVARVLQSHHEAWAFREAGDAAAAIPARVASAGWPPDLSSARLSFAGVEAVTLSGADALRLGYEGTRGCKLSLYVLPAGGVPRTSDFRASLHVRGWAIGEHGFLLMADGMPRRRFEDIAAALENSLRAGQPFDAPTRQRLARARRASPPCRA